YYRAVYATERVKQGKTCGCFIALALAFIFFLFTLMPVLLFSGIWGVVTGIVGIAYFLGCNWPDHGDYGYVSGAAVRREVYGVLGVFLVLVAANYALLLTDVG
ncbi:MAG: hypothetical protein ACKOBY_08335, partial [Cyanobium sp.]